MKNIIGIIIAVILIIVLYNPQWLPLSAETIEKIRELRIENFLIEGSRRITFAHIATLVLALAIVWLVYTILKLLLTQIGKKDEQAHTASTLLIALLKYLAVIVAFVWGLAILGVNTAAVLASVGIIGLILGFGAQSLIEDIVTGMFIIFEGQYKIGDIIILDDFRGTVKSIGVRTTTLVDPGGNLKIVNNSDIRNLQNRSREDSLGICDVSVSYSTDLRRLEQVLSENLPKMYMAHKDLYLGNPRYLGVQKLGDSGIELRLVVPTREENVFTAQRQLNRDVKILFDDYNIEIPFPQVVVHRGE